MAELGVIPKEIFNELKIREPRELTGRMGIVFDKRQAMIRLPSVMCETLRLKKGDACNLTIDRAGKNDKVICEILRGEATSGPAKANAKRR